MIINEISDFCRHYQYLQLEKPSGVEVEISVHKTSEMNLLEGGPTAYDDGIKKCDAFICTKNAVQKDRWIANSLQIYF